MKRSTPCDVQYIDYKSRFEGNRLYSDPVKAWCSKPAGHPGRTRSTGEVIADHGKRYEGPHGQHCQCGCHDVAFCASCDACWPSHIPADGCYDCATVIKESGHDPTDGLHYLMLIGLFPGHNHEFFRQCRTGHNWTVEFGR